MNIFKIIFGRKKLVADVDPPDTRLSDTKRIQDAFRAEVKAIFAETPGLPAGYPEFLPGRLNPHAVLNSFDSLAPRTLSNLGLRPEQISIFKTMMLLFIQCTRLEGTPQNIAIVEPLFRPAHPITPLVADAGKEVIDAFIDSIQ